MKSWRHYLSLARKTEKLEYRLAISLSPKNPHGKNPETGRKYQRPETFARALGVYQRSQADIFASWLARYLSNRQRGGPEGSTFTQGEGKLFQSHQIEVADRKIWGHLIALPVLDEFNEKREGEERIPTLVELGKQCADLARIPYENVLQIVKEGPRKGKVDAKAWDFDAKGTVRAAFVPDSVGEKRSIQCDIVIEGDPDDITIKSQSDVIL